MSLFRNINFDKLKQGLKKTSDKIINKVNEAFTGRAVVDEAFFERLEENLVTADIGYDTVSFLLDEVRKELKEEKDRSSETVIETLKTVLIRNLVSPDPENIERNIASHKPYVILVVGVNGAGKTTTIGKLANNFRLSGLNVLIGAADTFRAAANEQLEVWAKRSGVRIFQKGIGADPSSVVYETIREGIHTNADIIIIDTAGRLHTKTNLMEELDKIKRVSKKLLPDAPHDTFLVLDGNSGQNAVQQMNEFQKICDITGIIITKLDGTAKGGTIFQIGRKSSTPIRYIGVGEGIDDLQDFDPVLFVEAILDIHKN